MNMSLGYKCIYVAITTDDQNSHPIDKMADVDNEMEMIESESNVTDAHTEGMESQVDTQATSEKQAQRIHLQNCQLVQNAVQCASYPMIHPLMHLYGGDLDTIAPCYKALAMSCIWHNMYSWPAMKGTPTPSPLDSQPQMKNKDI